MENLIQQGKIRGWGLCNDNAYGLTACTRTAKALGVTPPCSIQGDFSLIDRKVSTKAKGVLQKRRCGPYSKPLALLYVERREWSGGSRIAIQRKCRLHGLQCLGGWNVDGQVHVDASGLG